MNITIPLTSGPIIVSDAECPIVAEAHEAGQSLYVRRHQDGRVFVYGKSNIQRHLDPPTEIPWSGGEEVVEADRNFDGVAAAIRRVAGEQFRPHLAVNCVESWAEANP